MTSERQMLQHMLAAIAYRAQKALRGAPEGFAQFRAAPGVRTPMELVRHMASVLGYARTFFIGGAYRADPRATFEEEIERLHGNLSTLEPHVAADPFDRITPLQLLQGPLSDVMSHAGQLALLRRLFGSPVPPEDFIYAQVSGENLGPDQPTPAAPDEVWTTPEEEAERPPD